MPYSIHVAKENFKFSAAHFIAYPGFREALHGHNYQVGIRVIGELGASGYVLDFGLIKELTRAILAQLDERTLIPTRSDCLKIEASGARVRVICADSEFVLPSSDVCLLPLVHSSAEELAAYIWTQLRDALEERRALQGINTLEVSVAEAPGQAAIYDAPVVIK
jgi:dihydroneopterin triphosphate aldolase (PTPS-III) / 6-pyruvoyltetrahydropterin synthase